MKYLLMIYVDEAVENAMSEAEMGTLMEGYGRLVEEMEAEGVLQGGERLQQVAAATSITSRSGSFAITDGAFAETKEQLGGYILIEAPSLDEAIGWAKKIPSAIHGTIEVRPIWELDEPPLAESAQADNSVAADS
ncbi:MAG: YciI family protein [Planctomycetota bacterium]